MFRFFCTLEQKVKRVRSIPTIIDKSTISLGDPSMRLGQCNSHFIPKVVRVIRSNKIVKPEVLVTKSKRRK